ncbi:MAG: hypothetical protein JO257_36070 [Deltaproteobacteria bacterium]|nr:hypothetical protein [Deltaproteobacteria bacterium]
MSIPIPSERIPPIAKEVADAKKTWAILWWFGTSLAALIAYGQNDTSHDDRASHVAGVLFWVVVLFFLGMRQWKLGRRATRAADLATTPHTSFVLANNLIVAIDDRGVSLPDATFKIGGKHVTMLTALPAATLVPKDSGLPRG